MKSLAYKLYLPLALLFSAALLSSHSIFEPPILQLIALVVAWALIRKRKNATGQAELTGLELFLLIAFCILALMASLFNVIIGIDIGTPEKSWFEQITSMKISVEQSYYFNWALDIVVLIMPVVALINYFKAKQAYKLPDTELPQ